MTAVSDIEHDHTEGLHDAPMTDPRGQTIDQGLIVRFMGACIDGCDLCQAALLAQFETDATATARVVELACIATQHMFDGLPENMTDPDCDTTAVPVAFRRITAAGLDGNTVRMYQLAESLTGEERREAVEAAARILVMIDI